MNCADQNPHQIPDVDARPFVGDDEILRRRQCAQPRDERRHERLDRRGLRACLPGDGNHHSQQVLRPVGELAHDEAHLLLVAFAMGNVDRGAGDADHGAVRFQVRLDVQIVPPPIGPLADADLAGKWPLRLHHALLQTFDLTAVGFRDDLVVGAAYDRADVCLVGVGPGVAQLGVLAEHHDLLRAEGQIEALQRLGETARQIGAHHVEPLGAGDIDRGADQAGQPIVVVRNGHDVHAEPGALIVPGASRSRTSAWSRFAGHGSCGRPPTHGPPRAGSPRPIYRRCPREAGRGAD